MSRYLLGIRPTAPGFDKWEVMPKGLLPAGGLTRVAGRHPVGLEVSFNIATGRFEVVSVPVKSTIGSIGIPIVRAGAKFMRAMRDGVDLNVTFDGEFAVVSGIRTPCVINVEYDSLHKAYSLRVPGSPVYPVIFAGEDRDTKGKWIRRYGKQGYILFGLKDENVDITFLPAWLSVHAHRGASALQNISWTASDAGVAYLQPPSGHTSTTMGALRTENPSACKQTFVLDVSLAADSSTTVSLYMADVGGEGREQVVEVFDLGNKKRRVSVEKCSRLSRWHLFVFQNGKERSFSHFVSARSQGGRRCTFRSVF